MSIFVEEFVGTNFSDYWQLGEASNARGLGGNDSLFGSSYRDNIDGGAGDDYLVGNNGIDSLKFNGSELTARNLLLTQNDNNLEITFDGVVNTLVVLENFALFELENASTGIGNLIFEGQSGITNSFDVVDSNFTGTTASNSVMFLNERDNLLNGSTLKNDVINGQGGDDKLSGLGGDDWLRGGTGNDTLIGGTGEDTLTGNAGSDVFAIAVNTKLDTITDFNLAQGDKIGLDGGLNFDRLSFSGNYIGLGTQALVSLTGINTTTLSAADFVVI